MTFPVAGRAPAAASRRELPNSEADQAGLTGGHRQEPLWRLARRRSPGIPLRRRASGDAVPRRWGMDGIE
jgi:hypothetical protein